MQSQSKLRILFVDDELLLLEMLRRSLAELEQSWEMHFVDNASTGLALAAQAPFDVIVSDLRMPGMDGIQFLTQVRERYPSTARIIYSSCFDEASILECVGVIHQFMPKPCPRDLLIASIQRAEMIRSLVPNAPARDKISKIQHIPSLPTLYMDLVRQVQSAETSVEDIAKTVSQDIGMAAQILRIANSAMFGARRPTSSIVEAVSRLGMETVKRLALGAGVFSQFQSRKLGGLSLEILWHHSARTATVAELIAKGDLAGSTVAADAFSAGLLHDIGKLVLASNYPNEYEEIARTAQLKGGVWLAEERAAFGFDHADIGAYLLGLWGLPIEIVEAVAFHHFPTQHPRTQFTALTAVHVANAIVQTREATYGGIVPSQIDHLYLAKIGRTDAWDRWREQFKEAPTI